MLLGAELPRHSSLAGLGQVAWRWGREPALCLETKQADFWSCDLALKDYSPALLSENRVLICVLVYTSIHGHYLQLCLNLQLTLWVDIIP